VTAAGGHSAWARRKALRVGANAAGGPEPPATRSGKPAPLRLPHLARGSVEPGGAENCREATPTGDPELSTDVEEFASATSVQPGEPLQFFVDSGGKAFDLAIYRTGFYNGAGARLVAPRRKGRGGEASRHARRDATTGLVGCGTCERVDTRSRSSDWVFRRLHRQADPSGHGRRELHPLRRP